MIDRRAVRDCSGTQARIGGRAMQLIVQLFDLRSQRLDLRTQRLRAFGNRIGFFLQPIHATSRTTPVCVFASHQCGRNKIATNTPSASIATATNGHVIASPSLQSCQKLFGPSNCDTPVSRVVAALTFAG